MNKLIYSVLIAFLIAILEGPIMIPLLHKFKFGQNIREDGPRSHLKKAGTPTMGGIIFILATFITMAILVRNPSDEAMVALYALVAFGVIGALDDILKIVKKRNLGLRAYQKMILLLVASGLFAFYAANNPSIGTSIIWPFTHKIWNLGKFYIPFIIIYFAATTNAVK